MTLCTSCLCFTVIIKPIICPCLIYLYKLYIQSPPSSTAVWHPCFVHCQRRLTHYRSVSMTCFTIIAFTLQKLLMVPKKRCRKLNENCNWWLIEFSWEKKKWKTVDMTRPLRWCQLVTDFMPHANSVSICQHLGTWRRIMKPLPPKIHLD